MDCGCGRKAVSNELRRRIDPLLGPVKNTIRQAPRRGLALQEITSGMMFVGTHSFDYSHIVGVEFVLDLTLPTPSFFRNPWA